MNSFQPTGANEISRRDFLNLSLAGFISLFFRPLKKYNGLLQDQYGRVTAPSIIVYDIPSFKGKEVSTYFRDEVFLITDITTSSEGPPYNKVWYYIPNEGYAHSGAIQPVRKLQNPVIYDIPRTGVLAEVTVPFTDAYRGPSRHYEASYRLYYETTHWISNVRDGNDGDAWYRIFDDKTKFSYYAPAKHLRLVTPGELSPISPDIPREGKRIEVNLTTQLVTAYEWDRVVYMARASTGVVSNDGLYSTPPGKHKIFYKRPCRHMVTGDPESNDFDLPGVPWVSYFTKNGIAIHGTYWHNNYGSVRSHGCVNISPQAAKWIYRWSHPTVPSNERDWIEDSGTEVDVID
jgi:lipoprotein-anchoring transpeptidase ErfK/SrfK